MKHVISLLLYIIVLLVYKFVKDYEFLFMCAAWQVGYWKELFDTNDAE